VCTLLQYRSINDRKHLWAVPKSQHKWVGSGHLCLVLVLNHVGPNLLEYEDLSGTLTMPSHTIYFVYFIAIYINQNPIPVWCLCLLLILGWGI
jgi:hypothetical protein